MISIIFLTFVPQVNASELNFSVSANIPENQVDKKQTYFDLRMKPGEKQTIEVTMRNDTSKDVEVEVNINTAITNSNGIIDYSQVDHEPDPTLKTNVEDLVDYEQSVIVKANNSLEYPIHLEMTDEMMDGIVLGGIHFQEKDDDQDKTSDAQIENKFAYIIGLKLSMNDDVIEPSLELNEVKPTQINYRNAVTANIQNTEPVIVSPLEIEAKIFKESGNNPLFVSENDDVRMAPNSNFDYAISWDNKEFKAGTYRLELTAKNDENEWEWEKKFTIEGDEAKDLNEEAVELEKDYTFWYIGIGIVLLIILMGIGYKLGTLKSNKD